MQSRVAVVGHVEWVDFVPVARIPQPGEVVHAEGAFTRAAGGGGVVAGVLAELGAEVDFFCALGRDAESDAAAAQLVERGVRMHVSRRAQPTRRAVTLLESGGERTIITIGERLDPLGSDPLPWERLREADGAYVTAGDAVALAHARRARVVVASPRARKALEGEGPKIDAIVFSDRDRDEREWVGRIGHRARLLVATDGAGGGSWTGESEGSWSAAEPPGKPRDSYGCGDSFAAGFTFGLAAGLAVADAARLGAERGALCLTRAGAP
jgi:ribokinase